MSGLHHALTGPADAPVVVLLHGLGACADDWQLQMPALSADYRVLSLDLPGHRHSSRAPGAASIPAMATEVTRLLDALAIDAAHVVGLSLGGCVALALAVQSAARVRSLVLVNTFARLPTSGVRATVRGASRLGLALVAPMRVVGAYVAREAFPEPHQHELRRAASERIEGNSRRRYLTCLAALIRFDVRRHLGEVRCPTLVIAGARDTTVPFTAKSLIARAIPGAWLRVVDDSGHVTPFDQPDAFNRLLLEHLARAHRLTASPSRRQ
jgi:3-oxoadipate enol-lactonase